MKKIIVLLLTKENEEQFVLAENVIRNTWAKNNNKKINSNETGTAIESRCLASFKFSKAPPNRIV